MTATTSAGRRCVLVSLPAPAPPRPRRRHGPPKTRTWLDGLTAEPDAGVGTAHRLRDHGRERPRTAAVRGGAAHITVSREPAPVAGATAGLALRLGRDRTGALPPVARQPAARRLPIERRPVTSLADEPGDLVINCTGLAARGARRRPRRVGAVRPGSVITDVGAVDRSVTLTDERDPDALFYLIPRRDEARARPAARCRGRPGAPAGDRPRRFTGRESWRTPPRLGLPIGPVRTRGAPACAPYRSEVRLEARGTDSSTTTAHGGAGYTLCRAVCAIAVAKLVGDA